MPEGTGNNGILSDMALGPHGMASGKVFLVKRNDEQLQGLRSSQRCKKHDHRRRGRAREAKKGGHHVAQQDEREQRTALLQISPRRPHEQ